VFNSWLSSLISKHSQSGILIDSNLLFIYGVGLLNPDYIGIQKGTRDYTVEDFRLLQHFLEKFGAVLTTPNIMTEASNLAGKLREDVRLVFRILLRETLIKLLTERYVATTSAVNYPFFDRLGVTDAAIGFLAEEDVLVLTDDLDLHLMLASRQLESVKYTTHLRPLTLDL
jgi:hypothetical protein